MWEEAREGRRDGGREGRGGCGVYFTCESDKPVFCL